MNTVIYRDDNWVTIKGPHGIRTFTNEALEQARRVALSPSFSWDLVTVKIDNLGYLFPRKELNKARRRGEAWRSGQIHQTRNEDINDKRMVSPRLSKQRVEFFRRQADATFHLRRKR